MWNQILECMTVQCSKLKCNVLPHIEYKSKIKISLSTLKITEVSAVVRVRAGLCSPKETVLQCSVSDWMTWSCRSKCLLIMWRPNNKRTVFLGAVWFYLTQTFVMLQWSGSPSLKTELKWTKADALKDSFTVWHGCPEIQTVSHSCTTRVHLFRTAYLYMSCWVFCISMWFF